MPVTKETITPDVQLIGKQEEVDAGLNAFAAELLAESFADANSSCPFKEKVVALINKTHQGEDVFIILTKRIPEAWHGLPVTRLSVRTNAAPK